MKQSQRQFRDSLFHPYCWSCPDKVNDKALQLEIFNKAELHDVKLAVIYYSSTVILNALREFDEKNILNNVMVRLNVIKVNAIINYLTYRTLL